MKRFYYYARLNDNDVAGTVVGKAFSADNTDRPDIIYSHSSGSVSLKNTRGRDSRLDYKISYYL